MSACLLIPAVVAPMREVANPVILLASDASSDITGEVCYAGWPAIRARLNTSPIAIAQA
jgi:hypothetical protein